MPTTDEVVAMRAVPGDLCRSVFRHAVRMSHQERDSIYGGSVILVGLEGARHVPLPDGSKLLR